MILVHLQSKPLNITVIQVCAPTTDAEEAEEEQFHEDLLELMQKPTNQTNTQKLLFITGGKVVEY